jgi:glycerol kinase
MKKYILSVDQGTTSSRAILFDKKAEIISQKNIEFRQIYPKPGWVEHDPYDILDSVTRCIKSVISDIDCNEIDSIGITNQRETAVLWNKKTGVPVSNAIVWQCRRTSNRCRQIKESGFDSIIYEKTGLIVDPYFSATKIEYLLDNIPGIRSMAEKGEIAFGTIDSWLVYNLTGGKHHVTDFSNASRTMIFDIHKLEWDEELLGYFNIPRIILPEVISNSQDNILTDRNIFGINIPIAGIAGDQQSSLFGQCCFNEGDIKNTYGTGCFLLMNTGKKAASSANKLLTTIAWNIGNETHYALEGAVFIAGAVIQWLRDSLKIIETSGESERMAAESENGNVVFVPSFSGLGTPYWDPDVRGAIFGLSRDTERKDITRAALEGIGFQAKDLIDSLKKDFGSAGTVRVDGGASRNGFLMQFQADILQSDIHVASMAETTALGAAFFAGLATGFFADMKYIAGLSKESVVYKPAISREDADEKFRKWKLAVDAVRTFKP